MEKIIYNSLQLREIFHLEFLRWFSRKIKAELYILKGGANLRFFFNSVRYSEDMDLDVRGIEVSLLKEGVMKILEAPLFKDTLKPFGIERIVPPDITRAKQTETTQRFKVHLITSADEDLFTKLELSRRGFKGTSIVQAVSNAILREYKTAPLLVSHYDIKSAIKQKIDALAARSVIQARDIFDLFVLIPQYKSFKPEEFKIDSGELAKAGGNVFEISFGIFRDTVISYLSAEDQKIFNSSAVWDEIRIKVSNFIDGLGE